MADWGEPKNGHENKALDVSNPQKSPTSNQEVTGAKPNLSPVELAAFWSLPIAPIAMLATVLGTTPQGIGRMGAFPTYRIGGGLFVKPIEVGHAFRGWKAEGGAA